MKVKNKIIYLMFVITIFGCAPTVQIQTPDKPLEINLNVKIDHEIKVRVHKDLDDVMEENKDIF